jgi:hypothetical protein
VGTNGPISDAALADIMAAVPLNATRVVFMTVHAPDFWIAPNNTRIKALPTIDKTVHIIDWDAQSKNTKLCPDGVHVTCNVASKQFYANLVLKELGLPAIK